MLFVKHYENMFIIERVLQLAAPREVVSLEAHVEVSAAGFFGSLGPPAAGCRSILWCLGLKCGSRWAFVTWITRNRPSHGGEREHRAGLEVVTLRPLPLLAS